MTSGINFGEESWKTEFLRGNEFVSESEWRWGDTQWLKASENGWVIDAVDVTADSQYTKEFGVTVNDTVKMDVVVDVWNEWSLS